MLLITKNQGSKHNSNQLEDINWGISYRHIHSEVGDSNRSSQSPKTGDVVTVFKIHGQFLFP